MIRMHVLFGWQILMESKSIKLMMVGDSYTGKTLLGIFMSKRESPDVVRPTEYNCECVCLSACVSVCVTVLSQGRYTYPVETITSI